MDLGGGSWTIAATPALNQYGGPVTITVTVSDGTTTTNETFDVTVTAGERCAGDHGAGGSDDRRRRDDGGAALYRERRGDGGGRPDGDGGEQQHDAHSQRQPDLSGSGRRQLDDRRHAGANQFGGPVTITVTVSDGTTTTNETFDVTVTAVNDAPVVAANTGSTVARGGTDSITIGELQVTDVDNTPAQLTYTVTVGPVNGQLELTHCSRRGHQQFHAGAD